MTQKPSQDSKNAIETLEIEARALRSCAERLSHPEPRALLDSVVAHLDRTLAQGAKIVLTGVGKSGKIAEKIAATLSSTGSLAVFVHPTEGLHGDLGLFRENDAVIAISYTGNTEEIIQLLPSLKKRGITVIGIGGNAQSKLARDCSYWIDASVEKEACPHNLAPTASTTLALALGDALAVALMKRRGFDAQNFAENHPGGSLGRRLHLRVKDLMHQGKDLPRVSQEASMKEVVVRSTEKKLGAVLVLEKERLLGIITDGDIRRALQHEEKFFTFRARDIMTAQPTVCAPETPLLEALSAMRDRPSQISVLPVVDAQGHCVGILRLHDVIQSI